MKQVHTSGSRALYASAALVLALLCFGAALALGFYDRPGLTQFVFAGLLLSIGGTVVGTTRKVLCRYDG